MSEEFDFSGLIRTEIPVKVRDGEEVREFVLRDASAATKARYRNKSANCAKYKAGEMSGIDGVGDLEPFLVAECLWERTAEGLKNFGPSLETVKAWPSAVVGPLFRKALEISRINDDETTAALIEQRDRLNRIIEKKIKEEELKESEAKNLLGVSAAG